MSFTLKRFFDVLTVFIFQAETVLSSKLLQEDVFAKVSTFSCHEIKIFVSRQRKPKNSNGASKSTGKFSTGRSSDWSILKEKEMLSFKRNL